MAVKRIVLVVLVLILSVSLMGGSCEKKKEIKRVQEMSESLCEAANDFNKLLIWRNYEMAGLMVVPSRRIDFLIEAEKYAGNLQIENFSVVVCQADETPPVRDLNLPDTTAPKDAAAPGKEKKPEEERRVIDKDEAVEAVKQNPVPKTDKSLYEAGIDRPKQKTPKKDKVYYGTVLVRYNNRSILPSATVDTKLIKQYWVSVGEVWYIDFEWTEILKR